MPNTERSDELRKKGLTPTIQRMAVLDCLEKTTKHPTADQVLAAVRKTFPSVSRGTVYNTLDALTRAGLILRITVDPAVARYDADLGPHAHFRCRICNTVYDIAMDRHIDLDEYVEGRHHVEAVLAYAYGVCEKCLKKDPSQKTPMGVSNEPTKSDKEKVSKTTSPSNSPANTAQRKRTAFSDEPTKSDKEKVSKTLSPSDSPSEEGGESPNA
jgi:Fur family transcriptional regulator, peroxide stress response regulator